MVSGLKVFDGLKIFDGLKLFDGLKVFYDLKVFNGLKWFIGLPQSLKTWIEHRYEHAFGLVLLTSINTTP